MISKNQIKFIKQLALKKHRQQQGLFVAEGPKVVADLLAAGFGVHTLYATTDWEAPDDMRSLHGMKPTLVTPDELRQASFLQHPQQVLAVFRLPASVATANATEPAVAETTGAFTLVLDGVQDPGNLGTIIRVADWFGIDRMVCSPDTADAWSPKVVQATMGSIARVNIYYTDLVRWLANCQLPICGTLLDGLNIYTASLPHKAVIVMGNEGNGISPQVRQLVTHKLLIPPVHTGPESLNVAIATAITCSEFCRRL